MKTEAAVRSCSVKLLFSKKFIKFTIKQLCQSLVLKRAAGHRVINDRLLHRYLFSCEFYKIFKNTYFKEHLRMVAKINHLSRGDKKRCNLVGRLYFNWFFRLFLWLFSIFRNQNAHKEKNELL